MNGQGMTCKIFLVRGRVQGVGFRPFVWRLARSLGLEGFVRNCPEGVEILACGGACAIEAFAARLAAAPPPAARLDSIEQKSARHADSGGSFVIAPTRARPGKTGSPDTLPGPDLGICEACLADLRASGGRRAGHAFVNCTDCGPRFSITRRMPYDRANTSMACFGMCATCAAEYSDPKNRRFHAQPIACPQCGPRLLLATGPGQPRAEYLTDARALAAAARIIRSGGIIALKGIGGFQLACDARDSEAVARLRRRKRRPSRAFAVMAADLDASRQLASPGRAHEQLLAAPERPIVLAPPAPDSGLSALIAPDAPMLGLMLPAAPLHAALFDCLDDAGMAPPALVMTSGNRPGEPICLGNRQALAELEDLADAWLMHDRDIVARVDDSIVMPAGFGPMLIRRARGHVPAPVEMPFSPSGSVLGAGAQQKATFCLTRHGEAWPGQHIGDLDSAASADFYRQALAHLEDLLGVRPSAVVCDLHPDYCSSALAMQYAGERSLPLFRLQHHAAHAAAVLAENGRAGPALALILDGTGLGADGTLWGGEILLLDLRKPGWRRLGGLSAFALPGGESAIRDPWRIAIGLLRGQGLTAPEWLRARPDYPAVCAMLDRSFNCPLSSGCGRLFDAVSALLGLCGQAGYEGQPAMLLEKAAHAASHGRDWGIAPLRENGLWRLDSAGLTRHVLMDMLAGAPTEEIALSFHRSLASGLASLLRNASAQTGIRQIGLSGGVIQNSLLGGLLGQELDRSGLEALWPRRIPPGDGGISYGQAVWGAALVAK